MFRVSLNTRVAATVFLLAVLLGGAVLVLHAALIATASEFAAQGDAAQVQWILRIDPRNAALHSRLGLLYQWEGADYPRAVQHLRQAAQLSPHSAGYWADLGSGCELTGEMDCARAAYEKAMVMAPMRPELEWNLANYYLRAGESNQALDRFARYLRFDIPLRAQALSVLSRSFDDPETVWRKAIRSSENPLLELTYLNDLKARKPQIPTASWWREVISQGKPFPVKAAVPYIDRLLDAGNDTQAVGAWSDLQARGLISRQQNGELVYNGNFEQELLNGGFDWHLQQQPYLESNFAKAESCRSSRCFHLDFAVPQNLEYEPVYELVPVLPNRKYLLTAFVRSQEISSDSGPRLRVVDAKCAECLQASTASTTGTSSWHKVEINFSTGPKTNLIRLSVWRPRSRVFPMEINGEFWLDSVSLKSIGGGDNSTS